MDGEIKLQIFNKSVLLISRIDFTGISHDLACILLSVTVQGVESQGITMNLTVLLDILIRRFF